MGHGSGSHDSINTGRQWTLRRHRHPIPAGVCIGAIVSIDQRCIAAIILIPIFVIVLSIGSFIGTVVVPVAFVDVRVVFYHGTITDPIFISPLLIVVRRLVFEREELRRASVFYYPLVLIILAR